MESAVTGQQEALLSVIVVVSLIGSYATSLDSQEVQRWNATRIWQNKISSERATSSQMFKSLADKSHLM